MRRLLLALAVALALLVPGAVRAQEACEPGAALLVLQPLLSDIIGEPVECEHAADNGDLLQATSTGLAFWQVSTQTPVFTNGPEHWAYSDGELAYWVEEPPPPRADAPAPPPQPAPPQAPVTVPPPEPALVGFNDATLEPARPFLYWAKRRCTYAVEAFERATPEAGVVISFNPNVDDPLGKPNLVRLNLAWPGTAVSRTAAGPVASANVGVYAVRWTSYTDRIVQDVVVPVRPVDNRMLETIKGDNIVPIRNSAGDYVVSDTANVTRFFVRAPTARDAQGRLGSASLAWSPPNATIALDPTFLGAARYPVTVSMTVEFAGMVCVS